MGTSLISFERDAIHMLLLNKEKGNSQLQLLSPLCTAGSSLIPAGSSSEPGYATEPITFLIRDNE